MSDQLDREGLGRSIGHTAQERRPARLRVHTPGEDLMHDIDSRQAEYWGEAEDGFEMDEYAFEAEEEFYGEAEGVFSEADELELAAELLEVGDEAELDQFLGKLISRAGRALGKVVRSPIGRSISGMLKNVAKQALPIAGGALGNLVAPGIGGAVGSQLASSAGSMFGLELEGMSAEDQEFEVARRIVRLGGEAVRQAADMPPTAPPAANAQAAMAAAAQQHAPGLVNRPAPPRAGNGHTPGRQRVIGYRMGNTIVLKLQ